jgi:hypothetical protein
MGDEAVYEKLPEVIIWGGIVVDAVDGDEEGLSAHRAIVTGFVRVFGVTVAIFVAVIFGVSSRCWNGGRCFDPMISCWLFILDISREEGRRVGRGGFSHAQFW